MNKEKEQLFTLDDGTPVFYGDILYHPDRRRVGWYCIAQFRQKEGLDTVTVCCDNGAVPTVLISELKTESPIEKRCSQCGQLLPASS